MAQSRSATSLSGGAMTRFAQCIKALPDQAGRAVASRRPRRPVVAADGIGFISGSCSYRKPSAPK